MSKMIRRGVKRTGRARVKPRRGLGAIYDPDSRRSPKLRGLDGVTKKDFQAIADILCEHRASDPLVSDVARYFKSQNSNFKTERFIDATRSCDRDYAFKKR